MKYVVLDLEWNQTYHEKALAVQRELESRLRGEVIQIGAVKLDKNMQPCGSYQVIVKPKYFKKIHKHVSVLTGITQEQMDLGVELPEAARKFKRWCGKNFAKTGRCSRISASVVRSAATGADHKAVSSWLQSL